MVSGGKSRKANSALKQWVTFVKKVQKEERISYPDAIHRAKVRKDSGEKWKHRGGGYDDINIKDDIGSDGINNIDVTENVDDDIEPQTAVVDDIEPQTAVVDDIEPQTAVVDDDDIETLTASVGGRRRKKRTKRASRKSKRSGSKSKGRKTKRRCLKRK